MREEGADASAVELPDGSRLNRYAVSAAAPRPESYREDEATASGVESAGARARLFGDLAAGAESGWDFSSRWLADGRNLSTIRTSRVLPVDLNAILYRNERTLQSLHAKRAAQLRCAGTDEAALRAASAHDVMVSRYEAAAAARRRAVHLWMWYGATSRWHDLLWEGGAVSHLAQESAASYLPLWAADAASADEAAAAIGALEAGGLVQAGGVATSLLHSMQQWDWPNAWPPLQQMLIEGLDRSGVPAGEALGAVIFADALLRTLPGVTHLTIFTDSSPVQVAINSAASPSPQINCIVAWLFQRHPSVQFMAVHQPGVRNTAADGFSRTASATVLADAEAAGAHITALHQREHDIALMHMALAAPQRTPTHHNSQEA